eukprot:6177955-Pleurochrysis_carterae.AAC.1
MDARLESELDMEAIGNLKPYFLDKSPRDKQAFESLERQSLEHQHLLSANDEAARRIDIMPKDRHNANCFHIDIMPKDLAVAYSISATSLARQQREESISTRIELSQSECWRASGSGVIRAFFSDKHNVVREARTV